MYIVGNRLHHQPPSTMTEIELYDNIISYEYFKDIFFFDYNFKAG